MAVSRHKESIQLTDELRAHILNQLRENSIPELLNILNPGDRKACQSYECVLKVARREFEAARQALAELRDSGTTRYFKMNAEYDLASAWENSLESGCSFDLVLTDAPLVLDIHSLSKLHASIRGVAIGVSTQPPPHDPFGENGKSIVSTFPMTVQHPFFQRWVGELEPEQKMKVFGEYVVHELGHSLFSMWDDYTPTRAGCMMQMSFETLVAAQRSAMLQKSSPCLWEQDMAKLTTTMKLYQKRNKDETLEELEQIEANMIARRSDYPALFRYYLGAAYIQVGKFVKAKSVFENALSFDLTEPRRNLFEEMLSYAEEKARH